MAVKHLIQNKVRSFAEGFASFWPISYNTDGDAQVSSAKAGRDLFASYYINEISSRFEADPKYSRELRQRRVGWTFQLRLKFNTEVSVEDFEDAWIKTPLLLSREDTSSYQVTIFLVSSDITHPPQQNSSTGTVAIFTLEAQVSRN